MRKSTTPLTPEQIEAEIARLHGLVDQFAGMMKFKLADKVCDNRIGWDDPANAEAIYNSLLAHAAGIRLAAGQEVDIANFAMFLLNLRTGGGRS